jgi:hypothetical protein
MTGTALEKQEGNRRPDHGGFKDEIIGVKTYGEGFSVQGSADI